MEKRARFRGLAEIIGTLAVVASLVFVGLEIRQSAAATRGATQQDLQIAAITVNLASANDRELSDLVFRFQSEATDVDNVQEFVGFTGGETRRIRNYFVAVFRLYEEAYYQYTIGNLDPILWAGWESNVRVLRDGAGFRRLWPLLSPRYSEGFRDFMNEALEAE